jgi:hypothetical protein
MGARVLHWTQDRNDLAPPLALGAMGMAMVVAFVAGPWIIVYRAVILPNHDPTCKTLTMLPLVVAAASRLVSRRRTFAQGQAASQWTS